MPRENLDVYCSKAVDRGATLSKPFPPLNIVTAPWVHLKCQFGCPHFGKNYCCPPYTPIWEQTRKIIDSYKKVILLHIEWTKGEQVVQKIKKFSEIMVNLENEMALDGYYKAFCMLPTHCMLCEECNLVRNLPCTSPQKVRPSMTSCGIDVYQTARESGFDIHPLRAADEAGNIFGLILVE